MSATTTCTVPACGGRMVEGKDRKGKPIAWCVACERRIAQLQSVTQKALKSDAPPPASPASSAAPRELSDADVREQFTKRWISFGAACKRAKRNPITVRAAMQRNEITWFRVSKRELYVAVGTLDLWIAKVNASPRSRAWGELQPHIPTTAEKALSADELAKKAKKRKNTVNVWLSSYGKTMGVRRIPADRDGKLTWAYYRPSEVSAHA